MSLTEACDYAWEVAGSLDSMHSINEDVKATETLAQEQISTLLAQAIGENTVEGKTRFVNKGRWGGVFHRDLKLANVVLGVEDG